MRCIDETSEDRTRAAAFYLDNHGAANAVMKGSKDKS
jgi:hypothetical protein